MKEGIGRDALRVTVLCQLNDLLSIRSLRKHYSLGSYSTSLNTMQLRTINDDNDEEESLGESEQHGNNPDSL